MRGANEPPDNLIGRRVGRLQTALHATRGYLASLGDVPAEALWHRVGHDASIAHLQSAKWMLANVAPARIAIRVSSLGAMADAVAAGLGVGWVLGPLAETRPIWYTCGPRQQNSIRRSGC